MFVRLLGVGMSWIWRGVLDRFIVGVDMFVRWLVVMMCGFWTDVLGRFIVGVMNVWLRVVGG